MPAQRGEAPDAPMFFPEPARFRAWLTKHHAAAREIWVGFHKKGSGRPSLTWPESVDEALCFGWIDGIRKRLDADRYVIRFTPRKRTSTWSAVNIKRIGELIARGRVRPAGLEAYAKRSEARSATYSYEQRAGATLGAALTKQFRSHRAAWAFFQEQPPWYRRTCTWWIVSAKREETRLRRLSSLIESSAKGRRLAAVEGSAKR